MARRIPAALALMAMAMSLTLEAQASPATDAFTASCNANPDFFEFAVTGLADDAESLGRLCSCLVTEFAPLSDAEFAMLNKDLEGTATAEDRTAFGDYTGLELKARDALDKCLVLEGFADGVDPGADQADMTRFSAACTTSAILLEVIGQAPDAAAKRTTLCECLVTAIGPQVSTAEADILSQDLDGTATDVSRNAFPGYAEATDKAGAAFDSCFASLAPPQ